jgi:hypothetical protein
MWNTNVRDAVNFLTAQPLAVLYTTAVQSIPTGAWTAFTFDSESIDRDGGHSTVTNTSRYTSQTSGWYLLLGTGVYATNTTGFRGLAIEQNGNVGNLYARLQLPPATAGQTSLTTGAVLFLTSGTDYAELAGFQNSGGALNTVITGLESPRLQVFWISS